VRLLYVNADEPDGYLINALQELGHLIQVEAGLEDGVAVAGLGGWQAVVYDAPTPTADESARIARAAPEAWLILIARRDAPAARIGALRAGADAWFARPYQFTEISAKLDALTRRKGAVQDPRAFELLPAERAVRLGGERLQLSRREYGLLAFLAAREGEVVPVESILEGVWGDEAEPRVELVRNHVSRLRAILERGRGWKLLHAVRGHGYCFRIEPA
jgi:two-component system copper resistance phosphate regulon response regulator CusR